MLKHSLLALMLAGVISMISFSAVAQDNGSNNQQSAPAGAPPEHGRGRGHMDPAKRTEMLTKKLDLNSEQQAKVLGILKSEQSQMEQLRSDSSTSQDDRRSKMMEIHKASADQIRGLLDSNQQQKWDTMQSEHGQWGRDHHDQQDTGTAPDSSQPK
jgi:periplasmic protein CpxP/Spy